jgi:hypothetical protein
LRRKVRWLEIEKRGGLCWRLRRKTRRQENERKEEKKGEKAKD